MSFVIKDPISKTYFARGGGFKPNINLAKQYASAGHAKTTLDAEIRLHSRSPSFRSTSHPVHGAIIVEVLLVDLSEVSDVQQPLIDDLLLVRKLEGQY